MELQLKNHSQEGLMSIPLVKGAVITLWGILALLLFQSSSLFLIKSFGVLNLLMSVLTICFTFMNPNLKISRQWLILEALVELTAGVVFLFAVNSTHGFFYYMSIGIFFIIILQFIYGYALLNAGSYNFMNIAMRFATLFIGAVIGVVLFTKMVSVEVGFLIVGIFSIIYGIINLQYGLFLRNPVLGKMK